MQAFATLTRQHNVKVVHAAGQPFEDKTPFFVAKSLILDYLEDASPSPGEWPRILSSLVTEDSRVSAFKFLGGLLGLKSLASEQETGPRGEGATADRGLVQNTSAARSIM